MLTHFTYKPYFSTTRHQEWTFSFFYNGTYYHGLYHYNGDIEWIDLSPGDELKQTLQSAIHELMLFHVYE